MEYCKGKTPQSQIRTSGAQPLRLLNALNEIKGEERERKNTMKIIFFGSSQFAVTSLQAVLKRHSVLAVFTQPDRKRGRSLLMGGTPVKTSAQDNNIPVFQPDNVCNEETRARLTQYKADVFVVVAFGQKLSKEVLRLPRRYCINVHSSLLPRWRGAAPVNWALINGDKTSGVSVIRMNEYMDCGDIMLSKTISIEDEDNAITLADKLSRLGAKALDEILTHIANNTMQFTPQDEQRATIARKLKKEDGLINWRDPAECIHNKVRGLLPWPCAYTYYKKQFLKIIKTRVVDFDAVLPSKTAAGHVEGIEKNQGIIVKTGQGSILLEKLQIEGKRVMSAYDFVLGHHLKPGERLG